MKKQSFLKGSAILLASVVITKLIGALFKIPLSNLIGGTGMGYFSSAYGLFMPVYALSVTGLPTAVAKLTAENSAFEEYKTVRKVKHIALILFSMIGLAASLFLILTAKPFTEYITETPEAMPAVIAIAPSVFFGCVMSVYRGYYEGLRNMYPTAVSQVIEAIIKLIFGLGGAYSVLWLGENKPEMLLNIIQKISFAETRPSLSEILLPYASAAAVFGITVSTAAGTLFLILRSKISGDGIIKQQLNTNTINIPSKSIAKQLILIMVPAAIGSLVTNLTSLIDLATISKCVKFAVQKLPETFSYLCLPKDEIPNFVYGSFIGLAVTVFNLIPSITNMFGKGILPNLAEAWAVKDNERIKKSIDSVILVTDLIAIPSGIGISVLSHEILTFLFGNRAAEIAVCERSLTALGIGIIFLSLSAPIFSMLQAVGKSSAPVKIMIVGVIIKLIGNLILIPIPFLNVTGAAISTTLCYAVICFLAIRTLSKSTNTKINFLAISLKPLYSGILCGITARIVYDFSERFLSDTVSLLVSIAFSGAIYLISAYLFGIFTKRMLKNFF